MTNTLRDKIRSATIGASNKIGTRIVEVGGGQKIEVRQPTIKQRNDLRELCVSKVPLGNGDFEMTHDGVAYQVWGVIRFCYAPGTDERIYDDADYDTLANQPSGGFMDTLFEMFVSISNVDVDVEKKS